MAHGHHHHSHKLFNPASAHKLEDPERLTWMPPGEIVAQLALDRGNNVADIGAGTGYFALPIAKAVAPGLVYAVDLQPEMLKLLDQKLGAPGAPDNLHLVEGDAAATRLADGCCDVALLANMWHEIDEHAPVLREMARILKPRGRVVVLDWRPDVDRPPGPPLEHRIPADDVRDTLEKNGWSVLSNQQVGTYSYLVIAARNHQ
jgi:ubiquinone/menaquinone biosynthesis C-methylase UbiE